MVRRSGDFASAAKNLFREANTLVVFQRSGNLLLDTAGDYSTRYFKLRGFDSNGAGSGTFHSMG